MCDRTSIGRHRGPVNSLSFNHRLHQVASDGGWDNSDLERDIAELNEKTGAIDLFAVKKVVEAVENPATELTLLEARRFDPAAELEF